MLSGIGDPDVLGEARHPDARAAAAASARNLQDRYEVPVVNRMTSSRGRCSTARRSRPAIAQYRDWAAQREGHLHDQRRAALASCSARAVGKPVPDLFCYARARPTSAATSPDTRKSIRKRHDCLTWVVLKGHTNNRGGSVTHHVAGSARRARRSTSATSRKAPTPAATICRPSSTASGSCGG